MGKQIGGKDYTTFRNIRAKEGALAMSDGTYNATLQIGTLAADKAIGVYPGTGKIPIGGTISIDWGTLSRETAFSTVTINTNQRIPDLAPGDAVVLFNGGNNTGFIGACSAYCNSAGSLTIRTVGSTTIVANGIVYTYLIIR